MKKDNDLLENLATAALAVAVIAACFKAFERSKETGLPVMVEENGALYEIAPNGTKRFIRNLSRPQVHLPQKFTIG